MPRILLAFGNKARVGKDEACSYLIDRYGGRIVRFADPVYSIAEHIQQYLSLPTGKNPLLLQYVGALRGNCGIPESVYADIARNKIRAILDETNDNIFIPDLRYINEFEMLGSLGFKCVRINRDNRIIDRDPTARSETELDCAPFDMEINNNGTLSAFYDSLSLIINN